jgi:hypothetical protein
MRTRSHDLGLANVVERTRADGSFEISPESIDEFFLATVRETPTMSQVFHAGDDALRHAMWASFTCGIRACELIRREFLKGQN